jgi:hypothetical protein
MLNLTTNRTYPATLTGSTLDTRSNAVAAKVNMVRLHLRARFAFLPMQDIEDAWQQQDQRPIDSIIHRITRPSHAGSCCIATFQAEPAIPEPKPSRAAKPAAAKLGRPPVVPMVTRLSVRREAFVRSAA